MLRVALAAFLVAAVFPAWGYWPAQFGTYTDKYYEKKWKKLCKGAGRYDAMREAYERGKPDPCSGAKTWVR